MPESLRPTLNEALVVSMTAFDGRRFFKAVFQPGDLLAMVAAVEAFIGLLIMRCGAKTPGVSDGDAAPRARRRS